MVKIIAVDRERHAGKGWRHPQVYAFAATQALVPLVGLEFAKVAVCMPIAFVEQSGRYLPVAVMSPVQGRNLFVAPNGQWLGNYVPAGLRSYPFGLGRVEGSDKVALCTDEDSGWVVDADANADATKFFEADGSPSAALKAVMELLQQIEQNRAHTDLAVAALAEARVIQPWPLIVKSDQQQVALKGLHRIDEAALNGLDGEIFLKLRNSLVLAYAQLISVHTLASFGPLAAMQQRLAQPPLPSASSLFAVDDGGTIKFN